MLVNIERVVDNLKNIKLNNIFFEAITNSIQAKATKIEIKIYSRNLYEDREKIPPYVDKIEIIDNGDGFNEENLKSFKEYGSKHKISLGCKGVGRFVYLKLFKHIDIKSKNIEFSFNVNGVEKERKASNSETKILFLKPKDDISIDFKDLEQSIREHFLAYFLIHHKNTMQPIEINIYNNDELKCNILSNQTPTFKEKQFNIGKYSFTLTYAYGNKELDNEGYYVADKRVVSKNSDLENEKKYNLFKDNELKIYFILESEYFNKNVSNERNELLIYPKQKNTLQFHDLCWEDIHNELDIQLKEIYKENGFDIDKTIKKNRKEAIKNFPYLGAYFDNSNELNIEQMQKNAKKEFENDKIFLRNENNKNDKDYEVKLSKVTQAELAEYVFDRNKLIQQLRESVKKGDIEAKIHNLFMSKKTLDDKQNYKTNNVWLFDDRFMSYDKIFSDIQIKDIFPKLHQNIEKRPDVLSIISNSYKKEKITDILLIEFKRPDNKITPAGAEEQLLEYGRYINSQVSEKIRIWAYAFLKFNDDVINRLQDKSYNRIFTSDKYPLYYKYHESNNMIINFLDYNSLICDAENRNKLFLDILQGEYLDNE
ncbi:ATP-binding protein [Helicobacter pullorum]|uniref:ATP-binding protein n=2 Tax=Helicobacter pullorum TaxID=35818 RepID=UPI0008169787|nr:ATP-binding protein [Helicobacter pullorum]OCR16900.1 ATPase [Helicobacter pullorum]OCR16957.1 ATPase [Helicobacter pullorum]OCR19983.1 ATPase [Helicobacter pullorum]